MRWMSVVRINPELGDPPNTKNPLGAKSHAPSVGMKRALIKDEVMNEKEKKYLPNDTVLDKGVWLVLYENLINGRVQDIRYHIPEDNTSLENHTLHGWGILSITEI